jgi:hypothetical protein
MVVVVCMVMSQQLGSVEVTARRSSSEVVTDWKSEPDDDAREE